MSGGLGSGWCERVRRALDEPGDRCERDEDDAALPWPDPEHEGGDGRPDEQDDDGEDGR